MPEECDNTSDASLPRAEQRPGAEEDYLAVVVRYVYRIIAWLRLGLLIGELTSDPIQAVPDGLKDHERQVSVTPGRGCSRRPA